MKSPLSAILFLLTPAHAIPKAVLQPTPTLRRPQPPKHDPPPQQPFSPQHAYASKYVTLRASFDDKLAHLLTDLQLAYRPGNPDVWAVDASQMISLTGNDVPTHLYKQFNADFLHSPDARPWLKKRAAMKTRLQHMGANRFNPLRQDLQKLASLSPVPTSMQHSHNLITEFARTMNSALDDLQSINSEAKWNPAISKFFNKSSHTPNIIDEIGAILYDIEQERTNASY